MIFTLLAALYGAAQEDFVVFEGAETSHYVANHQGSSYAWNIFVDFSPDIEANPNEYEFLTSPDKSEVSVQWKHTGQFYLVVNETDISGCSNIKVLAVNVVANSRTIGFETLTSSGCYNASGNGFSLPLKILDSSGVPLDSLLFPS